MSATSRSAADAAVPDQRRKRLAKVREIWIRPPRRARQEGVKLLAEYTIGQVLFSTMRPARQDSRARRSACRSKEQGELIKRSGRIP
jgi:hypothetical protein